MEMGMSVYSLLRSMTSGFDSFTLVNRIECISELSQKAKKDLALPLAVKSANSGHIRR